MRELFAMTIGILAFCVLLRAKVSRFMVITFGALLAGSLFLFFKSFSYNTFLCTLIPSFLVTLYCELCAKLFRAPVTVFLTGSIIPLLPGSLLYSSMHHLLLHDTHATVRYIGETIKSALGLGVGIMGMTLFLRYVHFRLKK